MPLYRQVADVIRARITSGELPPGHAIPSEHEIAHEFGVSRITATKATRVLRDEDGLIHTVQGKGSFVGSSDVTRVSKPRLYEKIAAEIAGEIQAGRPAVDQALPSEMALGQRFGVAKGTIRQAMALLREQGWVFTVAHRGTFVSDPEKWPR
ncbi:GntR family transcriptional regulator [Acrocarpospora catenulata]|uniref:GntR family transcriptional regulator n=1 Tax=Acrocarpospora catenulata TaxID=2836182 RepID=UPI0027E12578|nr:GntR family transcriptional regulator [Acrocarpospora catenulata]